MRKVLLVLLLLMSFMKVIPTEAAGVPVLCYHDVSNTSKASWAVTPQNLRAHFSYLKQSGYTPISIADYIKAARGEIELPAKPIMLTFDDGYVSFYTEIFPLLKEYRYPAVMALITSWLEYAPVDAGTILNWDQIREMEQSGLVTFASHTHQSHRYTTVNPQGDGHGMTEMMRYYNGEYESLDSYQQRLRDDLRQSQNLFLKELGHKVDVIAWPYGSYTQYALDIALSEGFSASLILNDGGANEPTVDNLGKIRRGIIYGNPSRQEFAKFLATNGQTDLITRAVQVDIDTIYDADDPKRTEQNITNLIERLEMANVNTVYLQAFSDSDGSGNINSVYFATTAAPVKADIFSHISLRLRAAGGFKIYAWMPTLSAQWLTADRPEDLVKAIDAGKQGWYRRATPFSPVVVERLQALFRDLAAYSFIDGVLFQDDLYLNDFEDFSPAAQDFFYQKTGVILTPEILQDPLIEDRWTRLKTEALIDLTQILAREIKIYRPDAKIARNIYALPIKEPQSQTWFAQNYQRYLDVYDYVVIMAYPYLEGEGADAGGWLERLSQSALIDPRTREKTVFKLQSYDWEKRRWISASELKRQATALRKNGIKHLAYYPEAGFPIFEEKIEQ